MDKTDKMLDDLITIIHKRNNIDINIKMDAVRHQDGNTCRTWNVYKGEYKVFPDVLFYLKIKNNITTINFGNDNGHLTAKELIQIATILENNNEG